MCRFLKKSYKEKQAEVFFKRYLIKKIEARAKVFQHKYGINGYEVLNGKSS